jgi:hypothetical protein
MIYVYFRDSLRRVELSTAVKVMADPADASVDILIDGSNSPVARFRHDDIAAFAMVDLGPVLQVAGAAQAGAVRGAQSFEHQQAPEFTDSAEAQIPE